MNELGFTENHVQEYIILRDYYIQTKDYSGILFILENPNSGEVFKRILPEEDANNIIEWKKLKKGEFKFESSIVERATRGNKMLVKTGLLKIEAGFPKKEVEVPAKMFVYQLV
jgi:hypothetical protein